MHAASATQAMFESLVESREGSTVVPSQQSYSPALLRVVAVLAMVWMTGCGLLDGATGPGSFQRRSVVLYEPAAGWEEAVLIDSITWLPAFVDTGYDMGMDQTVDGTFAARFVNLTERRLQLRYELRFYDPDDFLMDSFFPFGQPVQLEGNETRWIRGDFALDLSMDEALWLATMQLVARATAPTP
jgi:hypothetical protein